MNKFSFFLIGCMLSVSAWAQVDGTNNKRVLPNYAYTISLGIDSNQLIIREQSAITSFAVTDNNQLKSLSDTTRIFESLKFTEEQLSELYTQYLPTKTKNKSNLLDTLIDRAKELEGQRIIFSGSEEIANSETDEPMYTPSETDEKGFGFMQWLWIALGVLGGLLLGLVLGKSFKKKSTNETEPTDEHTSVDNESIEKVKKELAEVKTSLQHQLDFDKQYFEQSFQKIIIPLEKALEARDTQTIVPLLVQTMAHYTAITRFKLEKKQSFDLANMQLMMGTTTFAKTDFPVIDKNTSPDDIPNKLKSLIALLKNAEANKVEGSIVSGYKIDNL